MVVDGVPQPAAGAALLGDLPFTGMPLTSFSMLLTAPLATFAAAAAARFDWSKATMGGMPGGMPATIGAVTVVPVPPLGSWADAGATVIRASANAPRSTASFRSTTTPSHPVPVATFAVGV